MGNENSADKSREDLWSWSQAGQRVWGDHTFPPSGRGAPAARLGCAKQPRQFAAPLTDRPEQPKPKSLRKKSGRKPGGQPGHPGRTLALSDTPKHIRIHPLLECQRGEGLSHEPALDFQRRQVIDLPFTNNKAQRAFPMMKERLNISGCFRALEGAGCHVRIRSYISTLGKHGLPVLEYLRLALDGRPFLPSNNT